MPGSGGLKGFEGLAPLTLSAHRNFSGADPVGGYETNGQTLLTLFAAALGDFSMDFGEAHYRSFFSTNARLMMGVFIATITLLCLNLLIAFLTDAYTQVSEDKDKAFAWTRAAAVVETGERVRQGILPPPLNILQMHASMVGVCTGRSHSERQRIGLLVFTLLMPPLATALHRCRGRGGRCGPSPRGA